MTGEEVRASVWDEASSIVERATSGMPDVCSDIQAAVVEMVEVQLGNVYRLGYLKGLAEGPGWSGVSPMPGDRLLAAIRLRGIPEGEISWPTLGRAVFGDEGLHERREVIAELAALIDPGPGTFVGACPGCGCPYDEGWGYCCQCGERLPEEEWKGADA